MARQAQRGMTRGRLALLVLGLAAALLAVGPATTAQAGTTTAATTAAPICGAWFQATDVHYTSNHLMYVYLQERFCDGGAEHHFKLVVHNLSTNGVGSRAYGIQRCDDLSQPPWFFTGVFIPAGGTWVSVEENVLTHPVKGIIYAPRTDPDAHFIPDAQTGCV